MVNLNKISLFAYCRKVNLVVEVLILLSEVLLIGTCSCRLLVGPEDVNATHGQRVPLNCSTDILQYTVVWHFNDHEVFYGGEIPEKFKSQFQIETNSSKGEYNLIIPSASMWYNGRYNCTDDEGQGESKSAVLSVTAEPTQSTGTAEQQNDSNTMTTIIAISAVLGSIVFLIVLIFIGRISFIYHRNRKGHKTSGGDTPQVEETKPFKTESMKQGDNEQQNAASGVDRTSNPSVQANIVMYESISNQNQ